jgi:hypothetical protein
MRKMAILYPRCGHQCDVTLFEFGETVKCDCGAWIKLDSEKGVILEKSQSHRRKNSRL